MTSQTRYSVLTAILALGLLIGCGGENSTDKSSSETSQPSGKADGMNNGVDREDGAVEFSVFSARATRIEICFYEEAFSEAAESCRKMNRSGNQWRLEVDEAKLPGLESQGRVLYGYRAWGPNWPYKEDWEPGTEVGFKSDVDHRGNRFNPNKLLIDPYAKEITHDPVTPELIERGVGGTIYASGEENRTADTGKWAPRSIYFPEQDIEFDDRPERSFRHDIVYEVQVRGLTKNDPAIPEELRGTYAGAAKKAEYLADLGITAVEFLPIHETKNDKNDLKPESTDSSNYWGYSTINYFSPDRRYAADQSPGGPTREFKKMVKAFHDEGIKVFIDVVYNHTAEGGLWNKSNPKKATIFSWRGLDNHSYYQGAHSEPEPAKSDTGFDHGYYYDNNGVGPNLKTAGTPVRDMVVDSVEYWHEEMGVDGFRFDLAPILANECKHGCFEYNKFNGDNILNRLADEVPVRPKSGGEGAELIGEPWAIGGGTYQLGNFPAGWAEWNASYRDTVRKDQNKMGRAEVTPGQLASKFAGSSGLYGDDGRNPFHSVNFLVSHDGFTLKDLYSCNSKHNDQSWPYGPSDGGMNNNISWDHGGDLVRQKQAARTGMTLLMFSAGVPMIAGGDEFLRTTRCNNNTYNVDSVATWLDWENREENAEFYRFAKKLMSFRKDHTDLLSPKNFYSGSDEDGDGLKDITWYRDDGGEAGGGYMDNPEKHFIGFRIDGGEDDAFESVYVGYNGWRESIDIRIPENLEGHTWKRVIDTTAGVEPRHFTAPENGVRLDPGKSYTLGQRAVLVAVEK